VTGERKLEWWVVYDHPKDFPDGYIARKFLVTAEGAGPTDVVMWSDKLEEVQDFLENLGLVKLARDPSDDPVIVESWI
jgi:hypothetical protein